MIENNDRFPVWLTLFTVAIVSMLLALGFWQVQRLNWKLDLIAARDAAIAAEPLSAADLRTTNDPAAIDFHRVRIEGVFLPGKEVHVYATSTDGKAGYHVLVPLLMPGGYTLLVNRGWVPPEKKDASERPGSLIAGPVAISGVIRLPQGRGMFTPADDPASNTAYAVDPAAFAARLGVAGLETRFYLVADRDSTPPGGFPLGGQLKPGLKNNHLIYAITWFSTGIAVAIAFIFFLLQRRRRNPAA
ncbi:MAG: SURF1 family protein [Rhodospirillales bacterium]